jgi:hypothetical protein
MGSVHQGNQVLQQVHQGIKTKCGMHKDRWLKNFAQLFSFFDTVLEGHILTALAERCVPGVKEKISLLN